MDEKKQFEQLLDVAIARAERLAWIFGCCSWMCYVLAFVTGVAAAFVSITRFVDHNGWIAAALGITPSFCIGALSLFNFGARAQWEWDLAFIAKTTRTRLIFATIAEAKALVDEWNAKRAELRMRKPSFGALPNLIHSESRQAAEKQSALMDSTERLLSELRSVREAVTATAPKK